MHSENFFLFHHLFKQHSKWHLDDQELLDSCSLLAVSVDLSSNGSTVEFS